MQIIKQHWERQKDLLQEAIAAAEVIAIDFEFTGFSDMQEGKMTFQDSVETRYAKARYTACHFLPIQIGVSCFRWKEKKYEAKTFNVYLTPHSAKRSKSAELLTSALEFLRHNKFDFNKWIDCAVPYWRLSEVEKLSEPEVADFFSAPLSVESEKETAKLMNQVMDWQKQTNPKLLELDIPNYAIRLALYKQVKEVFGNLVFYTFFRGDSKVVIKVNRKELQKQQNQIKKKKSELATVSQPSPAPPAPPPPPVQVSQPDPPLSHNSSQKSSVVEEEKKEAHLEEVKEQGRQWAQRVQEWEGVIGFARAVEWIIQCNVPLVVHNGFYDLCLLYQHFIEELPTDFGTFAEQMRQLFKGGIFDTKHMQQHFYWIYANNLQSLYHCLEHNAITKTQLTIKHGEEFTRYENLNQAHEAGYDAYMTGCCFLRMAKSHEINEKFQEEKKAKEVEQVEKQLESMSVKEGNKIHEASKAMENTALKLEKIADFKNKLNLNSGLKTYYELNETASQPGDPQIGSLLIVEVLPLTPPDIFKEILLELADYTVKRVGPNRLQIELFHTHKPMESVIACVKERKEVLRVETYAESEKFTFVRKIS